MRAEGAVGRWPLTYIAQVMLVVLGLWALASALWLGRDIIFIAFFAVLVAMFLSLFVEPLVRLGVRRGLAVAAVLIVLVGSLVGLGMLAWPVVREQATLIREQVPAVLDRIEGMAAHATPGGADSADTSVEQRLRQRAQQELTSMISGTLPLLNTALGFLTGMLLVLAAGAFLAVDPKTYVNGIVRLVPRSHRAEMRGVLPKAGLALRQWIKGTAVGMVTIASLTTVGLMLIDLPAALALGMIAGLLEFVPYVGPAASFVPALAIALAISPQKAVAVVILYATIQFVESWLLIPLLMKGMVKLQPALTLLFQSFMAALFGFLGLLLAVPMLAFTKVLVTELYVEPVADEK